MMKLLSEQEAFEAHLATLYPDPTVRDMARKLDLELPTWNAGVAWANTINDSAINVIMDAVRRNGSFMTNAEILKYVGE